MAEVPVIVIPAGRSSEDGPVSPRRQALREAAERVARAGTDWPLERALELRRRALAVGSAQAASEFRLPIKRVLPTLAAHGLDLSRRTAPKTPAGSPAQELTRPPQPVTAPVAAPRPAPGPAPAPARRMGRPPKNGDWTKARALEVHRVYLDRGIDAASREARVTSCRVYEVFRQFGLRASRGRVSRWTATRAAELHAMYIEKGMHVAAAVAGVTPTRCYQLFEQFNLPRRSRGDAVHLAAERKHGRVPAGEPRGSVGCPRCGHIFIPERPPAGLEV